MLAEAAREAEPAISKVLLFHAENEIRLIYIDATAWPSSGVGDLERCGNALGEELSGLGFEIVLSGTS